MDLQSLQDRYDRAYEAWDGHRGGCVDCLGGRTLNCLVGYTLYNQQGAAHKAFHDADSQPEQDPASRALPRSAY